MHDTRTITCPCPSVEAREQPQGTAVYHRRTGAFIGIVAQRALSVPVKVDGVRSWVDVSIDYLLEVAETGE